MNPSSPIILACAADGRYALPLSVMLRSVVGNLSTGRRVEAYVVADGVEAGLREKVRSSLPASLSLHWVERPSGEFDGFPNWGRMALTTYHKLTLGDWLPADVGRAIWLDCDLLVLADLSRLWGSEISRQLVLAARDPIVPTVSSRFGVAGHRELGLPPDAAYFNAGVMLVDLDGWRRESVGLRASAYLQRFGRRVWFWDQEALNAALSGRWGELDARWNWHPLAERLGVPQAAQGEVPHILHFSGTRKPWAHHSREPHHKMYDYWIDQTSWAGFRPSPGHADRLLGAYAASRWRPVMRPLEHAHSHLVRWMTRR